MLLNIERREVQTHGLQRSAKATIKATPKVFSFFNDLTYSDKPVAILRELVANGYDAHKMAGYDGPVEVYLPDESDNTLRVVDHGIGMSQKFMLGDDETPSQFMAWTDGSTKNGDNNQIGGFGIGSKSPFSYTDQFMIRSIYDGVASIYSLFKDEDGIPEIGLLDEAPTDEGNGVEVIVPIQSQDFAAFREAAQKTLKYFDPIPVGIEPPQYASKGKGWAVRHTAGPLGVIMGGVRYEVNNAPYELRTHALASYGVDITVPIGTCAVALSRESLSMDTATVEALKTALDNVTEEIAESFGTMFDEQPSQWDAMEALWKELKGNHVRSSFVTRHAKYRSEHLKTHFRPSAETWQIQRRSGRNLNIPNPTWEYSNYVTPGKVHAVIVVDDDNRYVAKIRHRFTDAYRCDKIILVVKNLNDVFNPHPDIVHYTSKMDLPPPAERSRYKPVRKLYDYGDNEIFEIGNRTIKVEMLAFKKPNLTWDGLIDRNEVVFVNQKDKDAVAHLRDFADVYEERKKAYLDQWGTKLGNWAALEKRYSWEFAWIARHRKALGDLTSAQKTRPFGKLVNLYDKYKPDGQTPVLRHLITSVMPARVPTSIPLPWQIEYLMKQNDTVATNIIKELM